MDHFAVEKQSGSSGLIKKSPEHTFSIGMEDFLLDGRPFVIRCGEIHFARVPKEYWQHRLQMCRALGLNCVCIYLFWNFHEWEEGVFDWEGQADVAEFCRLAQAEGLWVLLRPGPYSCAEWEMGGLPWWLVKHESINLRSRDPLFLGPAGRFLTEVGRILAPQQITRGGPLLMVQVENEYGFYGHDAEYMGAIRQALLDAGFEVPLFACNPPSGLKNGYREDLFQVVNFGAGAAEESFTALRAFQKTGPLMNGEYYPAWFDMWGRSHRTGEAGPIVADLDYMLKHRHSFSIYMAHGGTSFGLWAGADRPFSPDTSSYDYDAPISEAGWVTSKFEAIREVFTQHLQAGETIPTPPAPSPVIEIPAFALTDVVAVFDSLPEAKVDETPRTMEFYGQSRGCTIYRTTLPAGPPGFLEVHAVHDFGWVFLNGVQAGVMDRRNKLFRIAIPERRDSLRLDILIEAMGRVNFGREVYDRKGLHGPVWLNFDQEAEGVELKDWEIFPLPLDERQIKGLDFGQEEPVGAAFWRGSFDLDLLGDTFLDLSLWGKGVVWVNGHCLGRFWNIGPTQTMYLPGPWLRSRGNEVVVFDLLGPAKAELRGLREPILDQLRLELDFADRGRAAGAVNLTDTTPVCSGSFSGNAGREVVRFPRSLIRRYLCFEAISVVGGGEVASVAEIDILDPNGNAWAKSAWKVLWTDSEDLAGGGGADNVLDGQPSSSWRSEAGKACPHQIVIDLGQTLDVSGICYLPPSGKREMSGRIQEFRVYLAENPFGLRVGK
jgi:beta-galactosidase